MSERRKNDTLLGIALIILLGIVYSFIVFNITDIYYKTITTFFGIISIGIVLFLTITLYDNHFTRFIDKLIERIKL